MHVSEVLYVDVEEWCGLYVDGTLVGEGDGMYLVDELDGLTMTFKRRSDVPSDDACVMEFGGFPKYLWGLLKYEEDYKG